MTDYDYDEEYEYDNAAVAHILNSRTSRTPSIMQCLHHLMVSAARDFKKTIPDINNEVAETLSCLLGAISPVGSSRAAIANTSTSSAVVGIEYPPLEQQCLTFLINGLAPSTSQSYATAQRKFSQLCSKLGKLHPSGAPCHAEGWTLPVFLQHFWLDTSIKVYLSGARGLHIQQGFQDPLLNCLPLEHAIPGIKGMQG